MHDHQNEQHTKEIFSSNRRLPMAPWEARKVPCELAALDDTNRQGRDHVAKIGHALYGSAG